jgi:putative aminopeptidase FrvX
MVDLLKTLCKVPGVTGFEEEAQDIVMVELQAVCDRVWRDRLGNVIGLKKASSGHGNCPKVMYAAHIDEIGFMVNHIDPQGFIRFSPIGGFDPCTLMAQRVVVHGRKKLHGVIAPRIPSALKQVDLHQVPELRDLYIDAGLPREEVEASVGIGDAISLDQDLRYLNDKVITGRNFDDRLGVYCMLEAMKSLGQTQVDVYAVSTVQEELGVRGAPAAVYAIEPDLGIAIDGSLAWDVPTIAGHEKQCHMGQGTGIYMMDGLTLGSPRLVRFLIELCQRKGIPFQRNIGGGTDASAMQRTKLGALSTTIGAPTRYMHSTVQLAHVDDLAATVNLLRAFAEHAHELGD